MRKKFSNSDYKYSDQTICIIGSKSKGKSNLNSKRINWEKGEFARSPKQPCGVITSTFEFPSLEIGGWAFQSIKDYNPKTAGYPFGGKYLYARLGLPQHEKLAWIISYLERVPGGILTPSGVAASHLAVLFNLPKGATILHSSPIYDCTRGAYAHIYPRLNIDSKTADFYDLSKLEKAIKEYKPYKLFCETPANPTMAMINLPKVYELATKYKVKELIVDNTFASPIIQKPAEIVGNDPQNILRIIHSGTKHLTGGLDGVCWGYTSLIDWEEFPQMLIFQKDMGYNMSGIDADAVLQHGIPTLYNRVKEQSESALQVAQFLKKHPLIKTVNYPGIQPFKSLADKYYTGEGYGSILYFEFKESIGKSRQESLAISEAFGDIIGLQSFICLGVSLGKINTLIENSYFMVHRFMSKQEKINAGISPFGWRLSVGSENPKDIIYDLELAMELMTDKQYRKTIQLYKKKIGKPNS